jgi:DNA helicase HerA-like ATPase
MYRAGAEERVVDLSAADRRAADQTTDRRIGRLVACDGARAIIVTHAQEGLGAQDAWSVGRLISIQSEGARAVGFIYDTSTRQMQWTEGELNPVNVHVELVGEVVDMPGGGARFSRGITRYPALGALAHRIRASDLATIYHLREGKGTEIGRLSQDEGIAATISVKDMLAQHFAILGSTGVGKSCAAAMLVRAAVTERPDLRVLVIDPHNEYAHAFGDIAHVIDAASFDFPFWMLTYEEMAEVVFRGQPMDQARDALRDMIVAAKQRYRQTPDAPAAAPVHGASVLKRPLDSVAPGPSVPQAFASSAAILGDTPVPYRISEVLKVIDEECGKLEPRWSKPMLRQLHARLEQLVNDARYGFMFGRVVDDTMEEVIAQIFRVPQRGKPVTVFQLGGVPADVVNVIVSVLGRMAFDLAMWSQGAFEVLMLCEEAHRYVPADEKIGFFPTRRAISRIAKEGRKYGAYVGVISQRPGEIDPSVLSQCSTIFAMRLSNDRDQEIVRKAIAENSARMVMLLSSISDREAIAFGQAVATPMRMKFAEQERRYLTRPPANGGGLFADEAVHELRGMIARMRGAAQRRF